MGENGGRWNGGGRKEANRDNNHIQKNNIAVRIKEGAGGGSVVSKQEGSRDVRLSGSGSINVSRIMKNHLDNNKEEEQYGWKTIRKTSAHLPPPPPPPPKSRTHVMATGPTTIGNGFRGMATTSDQKTDEYVHVQRGQNAEQLLGHHVGTLREGDIWGLKYFGGKLN